MLFSAAIKFQNFASEQLKPLRFTMKHLIVAFALVAGALALPAAVKEEEPDVQYLPFYQGEVKYDDNLTWKVVGGSSATSASQFPYIVSLRRSNSHFCGGSLISNVWILSAAHCTSGASASTITAVVGTITLNSGGTGYSISRITNHASYNPSTIANDVSILRTTNTVALGSTVSTIPIGTSTVGGGVNAVLSGWGRTVTGGSLPNTLQYITLQTITVAVCQQRLSPNPVFDTSLCTFTRAGQGACNGDSGGPLVVNNVQIGIVSWGIPCGQGFPDVFARVSSYASWITSNAN